MKRYFTIFFTLVTISVWGQHIKKQRFFVSIKTFKVDINNDGELDTIYISSSLKEDWKFNRIDIKLSNHSKKTFIAKDYWGEIDQGFLDSNKNMIKSKEIFIKKTSKQVVIILSAGTDGAGYGGEFSIINIENNNIKMVFDDNGKLDVELPEKLIDLNHNDILQFIYRDIGEVDKILKYGQVGEYRPHFVYTINDSCKLDSSLTKSYNLKHYLFAGYDNNNRLRIYYPDNGGKPKLLKRRRIEQ